MCKFINNFFFVECETKPNPSVMFLLSFRIEITPPTINLTQHMLISNKSAQNNNNNGNNIL
jgi:hypothetical protein